MEKNENKTLSRRQRKKFSPQLQEVFELNWYCVPPHQFSVAEARWRAPDHCLHAVPLITSWPVKTESSDPFRIFFFLPSSALLHRLREASAARLGIGAPRNDDYFDTFERSVWLLAPAATVVVLTDALSQIPTSYLFCNYKMNCLSPVQRLQCNHLFIYVGPAYLRCGVIMHRGQV